MAKKVRESQAQQPLPVSGERVLGLPSKGKFMKPPKAMTGVERGQVKKAKAQRAEWEATPEGQARTSRIETVSGVTAAHRYMIDNQNEAPSTGPRVYDVQLPGMADPHAAPRPPKWEELPESARAHTERALKKYGTSIDQMASDLGAQLDQAHLRSQRNGQDPYASRFYEEGSTQRDRISQSAEALGVPGIVHAQTNAFTSPNTKFEISRADGTKSYPNDDAAVHATRWVQQGGDPAAITNELSTTGSGEKRAQGYLTNIRKAATAIKQHLAGVSPADWRTDSGKDMFSQSPKTGPYANSWNDSHPQFTVSDVHTGGGGAFPHLSSDKPVLTNEDGSPRMNAAGTKEVRGKSEREIAIERTPFFHSANDNAMRQAMAQRNMTSVRRSQAMQWGEEQLQRGEAGLRGAPTERQAYPQRASQAPQQVEGQMSMFDNIRTHDGRQHEMVTPEASSARPDTKNRSRTAQRLGLDF